MTIFKHTDDSGDTLQFSGNGHDVLVESDPYVSIPNADVPTVALELLKAAGQESVIVAKSTAEVRVTKHGDVTCGSTTNQAVGAPSEGTACLRARAANYIALAEHIESTAAREVAEKAEAEAAMKKLTERRDALAKEYHALAYGLLGGGAQRAIDYIIKLEDEAAR